MSENETETIEKPAIEPTPQAVEATEPKKRGRKPLPRDANGNIIRDSVATASGAPTRHAKPVVQSVTDEEAGKAIQGAFMLASVGLGSHFRLFPQEQADMGQCFGPLFRKYPDKIGDTLSLLMIAPTVVGVMMPRIMVSKMIAAGEVKREEARSTVLTMVSFMEAEKQLNVAETVKEANDYFKAKVSGAVQHVANEHEKAG